MQRKKFFEFRWGFIALSAVLLAACGGGGGGSPPANPTVNGGSAAVAVVGLVEVSSLLKGQISASWLPASDDAVTAAGITYELHLASGVEDFTPSNTTLKFTGKALSTIVNGLTIGSVYAVKLVAIDSNAKRYTSTVKKVTVSIADPVVSASIQTIATSQVQQAFDAASQTIVLTPGTQLPTTGTYIATENGDGYLGKVASIQTLANGSIAVKTTDAALTEVVKNLQLSSSISLVSVPTIPTQVGLIATADAAGNTTKWTQTGLTLSSAEPPTKAKTSVAGPMQLGLTLAPVSSEKVTEPGWWGTLRMPKLVTVVEASTSNSQYVPIELLVTDPTVEVCKFEVMSDENGGALATATSGANSPKVFFTTTNIPYGIYQIKLRAYLDKKGNACAGPGFLSAWPAKPEISFQVAVATDSKFTTEEKEFGCKSIDPESKFQCSTEFDISNKVNFDFNPELNVNINFEDRLGISHIKNADFVVASRPNVTQIMHVTAKAQGALKNQTVKLIKERSFAKVFTAGPVPVILTGKYWVDMEIEGSATGTIEATELVKLGFDELNYGLKYDGASDSWSVVNTNKPRFTVNLTGNADATATVTVALVPQLTLKIYQYPTARLAVRPSLTGSAGMHGQVMTNAVNEGVTQDADYWLTDMTLKGQIDGYFYGAIEGLDNKPLLNLVYPKGAKAGDYRTYEPISIVAPTTFLSLPALQATPKPEATLVEDTRGMLIYAEAANTQSPFQRFVLPFGPESFLPFEAFELPKVISIGNIGYKVINPIDKAQQQTSDPLKQTQNQWIEFSKAGSYTVRVRGYSSMGSWARQVASDLVIEVKDENSNNIMDYWETRYGLKGSGADISNADTDGDGATNLEEWEQGTNPLIADRTSCKLTQVLQDKKCIAIGSATITATPSPSVVGQVVNFVVSTFQSAVKVVWDFGADVASVTKDVINGFSAQVSATFTTLGIKTVTATFRDALNNVVAESTTTVTVSPVTIPNAFIVDVVSNSTTKPGTIPKNGTTDDTTPTLSGTISAPLPSGHNVNVWDGANRLDPAAVVAPGGTTWTFTPATPLSGGLHSFTADVSDPVAMPGARSDPYVVNVLSTSVTTVSPAEIMRTLAGSFDIAGRDLPTSGISVTVPGDAKAICQAPNNLTASGFNVACQFYKLGAQTLEIRTSTALLGTVTVTVKTNVTGVTWTSPSTTNSGTVKFGETVVYSVAGVNMLADPTMGFAVQLCGVSNTETGTPSNTLRTFTCNFNNTAGAVKGQMTGEVKDAPGGQVLLDGWVVPVEVPVAPPAATGKLPDTGITASQCYAAGSNALVSCTSAAAIALNNQQDGMLGRDVVNNDSGDGKAGFSYSVVPDPSGIAGLNFAKTSCVKDNITGLVWEGKAADGGYRDYRKTYTNYGDDRVGDASAYVVAVNATGLCGAKDWRLPTADELQSLVDYGVAYPGPTIDASWFFNTQGGAFWSSSPYVGYADYAWFVYFSNGYVYGNFRSNAGYVRLVRAGQ